MSRSTIDIFAHLLNSISLRIDRDENRHNLKPCLFLYKHEKKIINLPSCIHSGNKIALSIQIFERVIDNIG